MHCILITINCFLADKNGAQNEFILPLRLTVFIHKLMVEQLSDSCRWKHGCFSIWYQWWLGRYQRQQLFDKFSENTIGIGLKKSKNIGTFTDGYAIQKRDR
jgi:hypothetical protein